MKTQLSGRQQGHTGAAAVLRGGTGNLLPARSLGIWSCCRRDTGLTLKAGGRKNWTSLFLSSLARSEHTERKRITATAQHSLVLKSPEGWEVVGLLVVKATPS